MLTAKQVRFLVLAILAAIAAAVGITRQPSETRAFDYYALVLGWSPSYCNTAGRDRHDRQCDSGNTRAFTLHGLWPQYEQGWPQDCRTGQRPFVPRNVIDQMYDIMPSASLIIHEYRAHGTCSGLDPARYFALMRELYQRVAVPARFAHPEAGLRLSPEEIEHEFLSANPWLAPEMISVSCRGGQLLDIRVCFGRDQQPRRCGANEDQHKLCQLDNIGVPRPAQR